MQSNTVPSLQIKKLVADALIPFRATNGSVGYDLFSAQQCVVPSRGKAMVSTGLAMAIPPQHYGRVAPRSSLAWRNCIDVGAGVIDSDYRGEVKVILFNHGDENFNVEKGDKIAQLIIEKVALPQVVEVDEIDETVRGEGGFGSTGSSHNDSNNNNNNCSDLKRKRMEEEKEETTSTTIIGN